ncbi:MAG: NADH-quinone oxidoreductase subunit G [Actinomycetales bacterium]
MTVTAKSAEQSVTPPVTASIDGVEVQVPKGTLIIRAAEGLGVAVPRFCDHPLLDPVAACRQCLVEVATPGPDGSLRPMPKPQPACAVELTEGMSVKTQLTSEVAEKAQHGVMEFLLINHPLDCPVCDKGGECPLQNQAISDGRAESRFVDIKRTFPKPIKISTAVLLDRERCIVCQRCTRFSKQIAGDPFIDLQKRGASQQIGIFSPGVLGISTRGEQMLDEKAVPFASYFSGNTIQICPVGALTSASYRFRSRPFDLVSTPGVCEHCACGCAQRTDTRRGVVLRRLAGNDPHVNEEWTCDKGRFAFTSTTLDDRLTAPMVRDDSGELREVSWPVALQLAAFGLIKARDGRLGDPDDEDDPRHRAVGVGVLPGGQLRAEDAYAYAKFARTVLGTHDIDHRARPGSDEELGFLGAHVAGTGLGVSYHSLDAASAVLLVGLEPEEEAPIVFLRLRKNVHARSLPVHAVAPFASRGLTKLAGTLVPTAPGTEAEVLRTLLDAHAARGAAQEWVGEHRATVDALNSGAVVILAGERLAGSPGAFTALSTLADAVGARLAWVPRRAGDRGAVDAGTLPGLLPGGRPVSDSDACDEVATAWDTTLPTQPGRTVGDMLTALEESRLGGLLVGGVDLDDLPDPAQARRALAAAGFVVSLEVRSSSVTEYADVVLPVAPPVESYGSYTTWEGRPRHFVQVLDSNAMSDTRVLGALATQAGVDLRLREVSDAAAELAALGQWTGPRPEPEPVPAPEPVTVQRGQAVLATWPLLLDLGRGQDGDPFLAGTAHRAHARLSAATAQAAGVATGDQVRVRTARGEITVPAVITDMPDHVVWLPTNSHGCTVRRTLGAVAGELVEVSAGPPGSAAGLTEGSAQ